MNSILFESHSLTAVAPQVSQAGDSAFMMSTCQGLSRLQTVDRSLVHRQAVNEVFITDLQPNGEVTWVAAQLPRSHSYYRPDDTDTHDPMIAVEAVRQATLASAHRSLSIPLGNHFVFNQLDMAVHDVTALKVSNAPTDVTIRLRLNIVRQRPNATVFTVEADVIVDDLDVARVDGTVTCLDPRTYERLRRHTHQQVDQSCMGLCLSPWRWVDARMPWRSARDTVLATTNDDDSADPTIYVRVDRAHPVLFEHDTDHLPGMLELEAMRQMVHAAAPAPVIQITSMRCAFERYAEINVPTCVIARTPNPDEPHQMEVELIQNENTVARGSFTYTEPRL